MSRLGRHATGVPAALAALRDHRVDAPRGHLLRMPPGAHRGTVTTPGVPQRRDQPAARGQRERGDPHPFRDDHLDPLGGVRGVGRAGSPRTAPRSGPAPADRRLQSRARLIVADGEDAEPAGPGTAAVSLAPDT